MEGLPLGRIADLVPEFAVKDLPLGRTLMMMMMMMMMLNATCWKWHFRLSLDSTCWQVLLNTTLLTCWRAIRRRWKHVKSTECSGRIGKNSAFPVLLPWQRTTARQRKFDIRKGWWSLAVGVACSVNASENGVVKRKNCGINYLILFSSHLII